MVTGAAFQGIVTGLAPGNDVEFADVSFRAGTTLHHTPLVVRHFALNVTVGHTRRQGEAGAKALCGTGAAAIVYGWVAVGAEPSMYWLLELVTHVTAQTIPGLAADR